MHASFVFLRVVLRLSVAASLSLAASAQMSNRQDSRHQSETWLEVEQHLPDRATATPQVLESQADILRARRFPEDALDYYRYALERGGDTAVLMNKIGLTELEMHNGLVAQSYFQRSVKANKKNAAAWNNLGAAEYLNGASEHAASDYRHAIRLDKTQAIFHANLATVRFAQKNYNAGRQEINVAMKLDPKVFEHPDGAGGVAAHVLSAEERGRLAFEMARLYARNGMQDEMFHSLAKASESGMNIQAEIRKDPLLAGFVENPRTLLILQDADALRTGRAMPSAANVTAAGVPSSTENKAAVE